MLLAVTSSIASGQPSSEVDSLPKVVLVGDSIRMSYSAQVSKRLAGKAQVISSKANGGDSNNVLKNLQGWVIVHQPTVVHFNCGIHDTKKFTETGEFQVSPEQYEANLRTIVTRLRDDTDAVLIFATSTPVLDERAKGTRQQKVYELFAASIDQYNAIAAKVMTELKVPVLDLHAAVMKPAAPATVETLIGADGVHLTPSAQELLGNRVAEAVMEHLPSSRE